MPRTESITRCSWAQGDPVMQRYHDEEWGLPQHDSRRLWEMLMLEGFQAGLAWITVLKKRAEFRKAFAGFVPAKVAQFDERDFQRLLANPGIIRSRAKIEATITGAKIFCSMAEHGEDFSVYCWSFTCGRTIQGDGVTVPVLTPLSERMSKDLKKRGFKFVGPTIVYAWMQAVGIVNDHALKCSFRERLPPK